MKGLKGTIDVDAGTRIYNLDAKIQVDQTKDGMTFTPVINLDIPNWKSLQVSGVMKVVVKDEFKMFESALDITGLTESPIHFQGE